MVTFLALLAVDTLLGNFKDFAIVFVKLLVLEVALGGFLELAVHLLPFEGPIHHLLDLLHTLLVFALLKNGLNLFGFKVVVGELLGN